MGLKKLSLLGTLALLSLISGACGGGVESEFPTHLTVEKTGSFVAPNGELWCNLLVTGDGGDIGPEDMVSVTVSGKEGSITTTMGGATNGEASLAYISSEDGCNEEITLAHMERGTIASDYMNVEGEGDQADPNVTSLEILMNK